MTGFIENLARDAIWDVCRYARRSACCSSNSSNSESAAQASDTLLFVEHPHVVTMGRNGKQQNRAGQSTRFWRAPASNFSRPIAAATSRIMVPGQLSAIRYLICENGGAMFTPISRAWSNR